MGTFQILYQFLVFEVNPGQGEVFSDGLRMSHGIGQPVTSPCTPLAALLPCPDTRRQSQSLDQPLGPPDAPPFPADQLARGQETLSNRDLWFHRGSGERRKGGCHRPQAAPLPLPWGGNQPLWGCGGDGGAWFVCFNKSSFNKVRAGRAEPG